DITLVFSAGFLFALFESFQRSPLKSHGRLESQQILLGKNLVVEKDDVPSAAVIRIKIQVKNRGAGVLSDFIDKTAVSPAPSVDGLFLIADHKKRTTLGKRFVDEKPEIQPLDDVCV